MRILFLAAAATSTLSMSVIADAADMRAPAYKAEPLPAPALSWTGCYVGAGGGYGTYNEETALTIVRSLPGLPVGTRFVDGLTQGGRGYFATAQVGCDYQFGGLVVGAFADGDWTRMKGRHTGQDVNIGLVEGQERLRREWTFGGRLGWVVNPQLLTFVSAGRSEASFDAVNYVTALFPNNGTSTGLSLPSRKYQGWFLGGGVEYAIGWLPGLFWKTEYRFADYRSRTDTVVCNTASLCGVVGPTAFAEENRPYVQTVRSELVWRFNFGGR
jgi:outer membrane immunogenic protein